MDEDGPSHEAGADAQSAAPQVVVPQVVALQGMAFHMERITRKSVLEHPLLAPRLDEIYDKARLQNPTLPATLEKFVNETIDEERGTKVVVNGHVN